MSITPGAAGVAASFPDGFTLGAGSVTAPTYKFSDTTTGFYRPAVNEWALASNGVQTWLVSATGISNIGPVAGGVEHVLNGSMAVKATGSTVTDPTLSRQANGELWFNNGGSDDAWGRISAGGASSLSLRSVFDIYGGSSFAKPAFNFWRGTNSLLSIAQSGSVTVGPISAIGGNTFSGNNIVGKTNASAVAAGYVGETLSSGRVGAGVTVTTGTPVALGSRAVGPGVWRLSAVVTAVTGVGGISYFETSISTTNNALGTRGDSDTAIGLVISATGVGNTVMIERFVNISTTTTTYYLTAQTAGANSSAGGILGTLVATRIA